MIEKEIKVRVRYSETDKMGYVYYGNYASYFEVARVETLRSLGVSYKKLEDDGVMLPVLEFKIKYFKPAYYDDELSIKIRIEEMPKVRIHFYYESYNAEGVILNKAETTLVFVDIKSGRPCEMPDDLVPYFKPFFKA
jgi:acyl-CoA thioester hydrolase